MDYSMNYLRIIPTFGERLFSVIFDIFWFFPVHFERGSRKETCPVLISARSAGDLIAAVQPAATIGATDTLKAHKE